MFIPRRRMHATAGRHAVGRPVPLHASNSPAGLIADADDASEPRRGGYKEDFSSAASLWPVALVTCHLGFLQGS